ncbi:MAG: prepilin-type N-terminal cleavage/methylation domain-containing protein [Magnetococcales bacterium]|nr:prepilin-type N-terminal cleavage/methylation domain-containing protein [Magnetococcales bacterium]
MAAPLKTPPPSSQSGFTLVELIMVMVIIGIISVFAVDRAPDSLLNVDAAARQVAQEIRYTQSLAMAGNALALGATTQDHSFVYVDSDSYLIRQDADGSTIASDDLVNVTFDSPFADITFDGKGDPGGTTTTITVTADGNSMDIVVIKNTGAVIIQ